MLAIVGMSFLSCEDDIFVDRPVLTIFGPADTTLQLGDTVQFNIQATSGANLSSFRIIRSRNGIEKTIIDTTFGDTNAFTFKRKVVPSTTSEGANVYAITVENEVRELATGQVTIVVNNSLSEAVEGKVFNRFGDSLSSYDFVNEIGRSGADSSQMDIIDVTETAAIWSQSFGSGNGTQFVLVDDITFRYAKLPQIIAAYNNGTPSSETGLLEEGDMFVAYNTRFPQDYVLVEIREVQSTLTDNDDFLRFRYRK